MTQPTVLQDGDWFEVRRLFELLLGRAVDTGGQSVGLRFGLQNLSFTAAVTANATVTHGLGRTPAAVFATAASGTSALVNCTVGTVGATTFVLAGRYVDAVARTATEPVYWLAIG